MIAHGPSANAPRFRNHFSVLGNAGAEPTARLTSNGGLVATVNVATNYHHKDGATDRWVESTEWHRITAFDALANTLQEAVKKGTRIAVDGYMRTRKFVDAQNQERYAHELIATHLRFGADADPLAIAAPSPSASVASAEEDPAGEDLRVI